MPEEPIVVTTEGALSHVQFNRPEVLNALTLSMRKDLKAIFDDLSSNRDVHAIILSGAGASFCAGGDVSELATVGSADALSERMKHGNEAIRAIWECPKPVVAAVQGAAAGFGSCLALACDHIVASKEARFVPAFIRLGLAPDGGASFLISQRVGKTRARGILLSGKTISAAYALSMGLIDEVVEANEVLDTARKWASLHLEYSLDAMKATKELVSQAEEFGLALAAEVREQSTLVNSPEHLEARKSFLSSKKSKRP